MKREKGIYDSLNKKIEIFIQEEEIYYDEDDEDE
jgi:hypothetical protein